MLNGIKSSIILKKIMSLLKQERKLRLTIYNKKINQILNLAFIDYMILSGKYLVEGKEGTKRIYDSFKDELIYEGEYLKGKKNGKGKEYSNDNIIFEGEYLNGKRKKGKLYDKYGFLVFEGEFLEGNLWNGYGTEYDEYHNIIFEGEYINSKKGYSKISKDIKKEKDNYNDSKEGNCTLGAGVNAIKEDLPHMLII